MIICRYNRFIKLNESVQEWNDKLLDYSWRGDLNGVKKCIKNGADVNCKDYYNKTPLIWSSQYGYSEIVKVLIENGADVNCRNYFGNTPLIRATYYNHLKVVKILIENSADWNIKNKDNKDFTDYLSGENKEIIIREYPEQYKEYLFKKDVEKYNL